MDKINFFKRRSIFRPISLIYISVFVLITALLAYRGYDIPPPPVEKPQINYFADLPLKARAVYVFDSKENRILFEKNARTPLPLASITKLMTVHCALMNNTTNNYVTVPDKVYAYNDHATSTGLTEHWKIDDLATYTLVASSNAGAVTLANTMGGEDKTVACMNDEAQKLNLFETKFSNVTGLDIDANTPGAVGSAENVVTLFQNVYFSATEIINKTAFENFNIYSKNGIIHKAQNTNIIAEQITGFLGSKTGLTDIAGGNLTFGMNVGLNHMIFVAILGSTEEGRFSDALTISDAVTKSFAN
ncbi:MAG: serine-type D-Ala-D-Ala carboxypeptidase D-alanyl-D-alanine carboxypeptidase [Candidatus Taylorbacteria bacterium]|nr:serine-type D-Ala-D-Ala carboxypeptidase D-alanyl-D-alanine carboxypeptidase [Candidatus Taylorbacteria bacterium]